MTPRGRSLHMVRAAALVGFLALAGVIVWQLAASDEPEPATPIDAVAAEVAADAVEDAAEEPAPPPPVLRPVPALEGIDGWMNTDVEGLDANRSQVTVIQFWTFGCSNCKATLDNLRSLYDRYRDDGLEIIGVHAPEFSYEADPANIAQALVDLDITWPVALDTDKRNFHSWQEGPRGFWPRTYVVDASGNIRFDHIGEGKYDELNATVVRLLADAT